jgi:hypothetical protein
MLDKKIHDDHRLRVTREVIMEDPATRPAADLLKDEIKPVRVERLTFSLVDGGGVRDIWATDWAYRPLLPRSLLPGKVLDATVESDRMYFVFRWAYATLFCAAEMRGPPQLLSKAGSCCVLLWNRDEHFEFVHSAHISDPAQDGSFTVTLDVENTEGIRRDRTYAVRLKDGVPEVASVDGRPPEPTTTPSR